MTASMAETIQTLRAAEEVGHDMMRAAVTDMLSGKTTERENVDFLGALASKGETDGELLAMLETIQEFAVPVRPATGGIGAAIDMCGTGGDGLHTFNVSTAASFVVAAAGGTVAKHGNRSSSGVSGSADIFEYFGYDLEQGPEQVASILARHRICFMFAQRFHPAMMRVASARKRLGIRTAFNLLGPLSNPAGVKNQLVGVSSPDLLYRLPMLLGRRGAHNVMAVRSADGMDEFSTSAPNNVAVLMPNGDVETSTVDAESIGLHRSSLGQIRVRTKQEAVSSFVGSVNGTAPRAMVETVALNAAAGLVVAGIADGFGDGVEAALLAIRDGRAYKTLERFVRDTGDIVRLEGIVHA